MLNHGYYPFMELEDLGKMGLDMQRQFRYFKDLKSNHSLKEIARNLKYMSLKEDKHAKPSEDFPELESQFVNILEKMSDSIEMLKFSDQPNYDMI